MAGAASPFAPTSYPEAPALAGIRLATAEAGIRYKGRTDLLLVRFDPAATVAGVFTKSRCASAPVDWDRARLKGGKARALVVNSGNANAFTGMKGRQAVEATAQAAASAVGCDVGEVFLASTGVIGEPLDPKPFADNLARLATRGGARWLSRRGARHHDHRHLPEACDAEGPCRLGRHRHQRHRQGIGHDRARHGDDALLHLHRCADRRGRVAIVSRRRGRR